MGPMYSKKWPFLRQKKHGGEFSTNFGSIFGQFAKEKTAIFSRQKKEANFEQLWVNFGPIYAKKWPFFLGEKRRPILNNFWPIYIKKCPFFLAKNMEANFEQIGVNFWPIC